jgi:hypothetical protein
MGKTLILIGLVILAIGALVHFFGNRLGWFGRLPGDIRVERGNFTFYSPFMSMLILSVVLSLILWLVQRFLR